MDWILDNIQFVIAFVAAFVWWLNKRREEAGSEDDGARPPPGMEEADFEDEERARRIQEEIRRKIAERRTLPPVAPGPLYEPQRVPAREAPRPVQPPVQPVQSTGTAGQVILEQQRQLEASLRRVEESRRAAAAIRARVTGVAPRPSRPEVRGIPGGLAGDLRGAANLRRAIVLREILGPPKGLQG